MKFKIGDEVLVKMDIFSPVLGRERHLYQIYGTIESIESENIPIKLLLLNKEDVGNRCSFYEKELKFKVKYLEI